jgi:hypothetical protein
MLRILKVYNPGACCATGENMCMMPELISISNQEETNFTLAINRCHIRKEQISDQEETIS